MSKVLLSVVLALLVGGAVVAGIGFLPAKPEEVAQSDGEALFEVAALRESLEGTREALRLVSERLDQLESAQKELAAVRELQQIGTPGEGAAAEAKEIVPPDLRSYVFACIDEERKLREEEQRKQREELRQRMEERRKEREELSKGPYERYNLKVNSVAKELGLDDSQREAYYELVKRYSEKYSEARRELFAAARETREGEGGEERGRGRGGMRGMREGREQYRELAENLQKEYTAELEPLLTASQLDAYNELSERSQSFADLGQASTGDEGFSGMRSMFGFGGGRGPGGGRRGGGRGR
jgi:hypothetical protein